MNISRLGNIIAERRKEIGMTQDALAEALTITPQAAQATSAAKLSQPTRPK